MDFFDSVKERHSVRKFKNKAIEEEKLRKILEAANTAPSAGNRQAYEIFVIKNENKKKALVHASDEQEFIAEAPIVLVFCADPRKSYEGRGDFYSLQDATIAAAYTQLAATSLGLSTCWVGDFDDTEILKIIGKKNMKPICVMPLGYANEVPKNRGRRKLSDIVHEI